MKKETVHLRRDVRAVQMITLEIPIDDDMPPEERRRLACARAKAYGFAAVQAGQNLPWKVERFVEDGPEIIPQITATHDDNEIPF